MRSCHCPAPAAGQPDARVPAARAHRPAGAPRQSFPCGAAQEVSTPAVSQADALQLKISCFRYASGALPAFMAVIRSVPPPPPPPRARARPGTGCKALGASHVERLAALGLHASSDGSSSLCVTGQTARRRPRSGCPVQSLPSRQGRPTRPTGLTRQCQRATPGRSRARSEVKRRACVT